MAVKPEEQQEARKRVLEYFKDEKYKIGAEPQHETPDVSEDNKPFESFSETPDGWLPKKWKKVDDTFYMDEEPEEPA